MSKPLSRRALIAAASAAAAIPVLLAACATGQTAQPALV